MKKLFVALPFVVAAGATCRFDFNNPAEQMKPGEVHGRIVMEAERLPDGGVLDGPAIVPVAGATVTLKGVPYTFTTKADGRFAMFNMPPGEYTLVAEYGSGDDYLARIRKVTIGIDPATGYADGTMLDDITILYTAKGVGSVVTAGGVGVPNLSVVDGLSGISRDSADAGVFTYAALAVGPHSFSAGDLTGTSNLFGGTLEREVTRDEQRKTVQLAPIVVAPASGLGRLRGRLAFFMPSTTRDGGLPPPSQLQATLNPQSFGTQQEPIRVELTAEYGFETDVPTGAWSLQVSPRFDSPSGTAFTSPGMDEGFHGFGYLSNIVVLKDKLTDLGTVPVINYDWELEQQQNQDSFLVEADAGTSLDAGLFGKADAGVATGGCGCGLNMTAPSAVDGAGSCPFTYEPSMGETCALVMPLYCWNLCPKDEFGEIIDPIGCYNPCMQGVVSFEPGQLVSGPDGCYYVVTCPSI